MATKELICIGCPLGCSLSVLIEENEVRSVEGNTCKIGEKYAIKECTKPSRMVTGTCVVENGIIPMVSVKTQTEIPKEEVMNCIRALKGVRVTAPVHIGDVILENVAGCHVNVVATKNVESR